MIEAEQPFSQPSRQSPLAIVFLAWRILRQVSLVNLIFIAVAISSGRLPISGLALITLVLAALAVSAALSWWRFVFVIKEGELRVDKGVLAQEHLAIPLNRVQTVSLEQGLFHQILGLTRVSVDTAGSSVVEFKFDALDRRQAELLQQVVGHHRAMLRAEADIGEMDSAGIDDRALLDAPPPIGPPTSSVAPQDLVPAGVASGGQARLGPLDLDSMPPPLEPQVEPEVVAFRSFVDLVKIGVGSWPWAGLVFVFPLLAVVDQLQELVGLDVFGNVTDWIDDVEAGRVDPQVSVPTLVAFVLGFLLLATIAGWLFQIIRAVLTNWEMTISRIRTSSGDSLRRDAGLLNRTTVSANLARVQSLRVSQAPIQRWLGIRNVTMLITGETNIQIPGTTESELKTFTDLALTGSEPHLNRRVAQAYILREGRTALVIGSAVGVVTALTLGRWGVLAILIPVQAAVGALMYVRTMRWGFTDNRIAYRHGVLNRREHHVEFVKAQSVAVRQSFFERRRDLATFRLHTAEAEFSIPFIPKADADALRDIVLHYVETSTRSWM